MTYFFILYKNNALWSFLVFCHLRHQVQAQFAAKGRVATSIFLYILGFNKVRKKKKTFKSLRTIRKNISDKVLTHCTRGSTLWLIFVAFWQCSQLSLLLSCLYLGLNNALLESCPTLSVLLHL